MYKEISLADALDFIVDNRGKTVPIQESGFPLIATNCISNENLYPEFKNLRYVSNDIYSNWFRAHPEPEDVIITNKGSKNGAICIVPDPVTFCIAQDMVALRAKKGVVYPRYLFAVLRSDLVQNRIKKLNVDAVIPHFKKTDFDKLFFPLPDYDKQVEIGDCYFNFCKKIDLHHKTNLTLEQISQAIFKSWFIDFDPVKAKITVLKAGGSIEDAELAAIGVISSKSPKELAALKQIDPENYEKLAETASLFPSAMQNSELGKIPEGWSYTTFGKISKCFDSKRIPLSKRKREEKKPGSIPYYGAASIVDYINEWIFDDTYLLLGEDGSVLRKDGTPFIQYIWGKSWINNHAHVLQGDNGISTEHLMVFIKNTNISSYVTGAVQLKLNQKNMNSIPFLKATNSINKSYQNIIYKLYEKIKNHKKENQSLISIRDSLLPKLISGEILCNEAEK